MIELLAYSRDRIVHGNVSLPGERLMDLLEGTHVVDAVDVQVLGLHFQATESTVRLDVVPGDFHVVVATGPRGDHDQRVPTRIVPVTADVGPYRVFGRLHTPDHPSADEEMQGRTWFAVTDAVLEYTRGFQPIRERHGAVLINRRLAQRIIPVDGEALEARWLASRQPREWEPVAIAV